MPRKKKVEERVVSIEDIKKEYPIEFTYVDINGNEKTTYIKSKLSILEEHKFIKMVTFPVINNEHGYSPVWKSYAFKSNVIGFFTNILLPDTINKVYTLIEETDLYSNIVNIINRENKGYIDYLYDMVTDMIDFERKCYQNKSEFDFLCNDMRNVLSKYSGKITNADVKNIKTIVRKIANNLDSDMINGFITSLTNKIQFKR